MERPVSKSPAARALFWVVMAAAVALTSGCIAGAETNVSGRGDAASHGAVKSDGFPPEDAYYVSPDGSDRGRGSLKSPWRTIRHAVRRTGPGDSVILRGGTYEEEIELSGARGMGGSSGRFWTLRGYPGEDAVLTDRIYINADYVRIKGLHIVGPGGKLAVSDWRGYGRHVQIVDNYITGAFTNYSGVLNTWGSDTLFEGNTLELTYSGTQTHGIYVMAGKDSKGNRGRLENSGTVIRNNRIVNPSQYGIHVYDSRKKDRDPARLITNLLIEDNYVANSDSRSGIIIQAGRDTRISKVMIRNNVIANNPDDGIRIKDLGDGIDDIRIFNNTVYGSGKSGILIAPGRVSGVEIRNNIISGVGRQHVNDWGEPRSISIDNNLYWPAPPQFHGAPDSSPLAADPMFTDAAGGQFHLRPGSGAVDSGVALPEVEYDKDGVRRPRGRAYDMGAYEDY